MSTNHISKNNPIVVGVVGTGDVGAAITLALAGPSPSMPCIVTTTTHPEMDSDVVVIRKDGSTEQVSREQLERELNQMVDYTVLDVNPAIDMDSVGEEEPVKNQPPFYAGLPRYKKRKKR